jgi:hypothetical protein
VKRMRALRMAHHHCVKTLIEGVVLLLERHGAPTKVGKQSASSVHKVMTRLGFPQDYGGKCLYLAPSRAETEKKENKRRDRGAGRVDGGCSILRRSSSSSGSRSCGSYCGRVGEVGAEVDMCEVGGGRAFLFSPIEIAALLADALIQST